MATFVSPIDGKTYNTEWTGGAKTRTVANPVYDAYLRGQGKSESFDPAAMAMGRLTLLLTGLGGTSACRVAMNWKELR